MSQENDRSRQSPSDSSLFTVAARYPDQYSSDHPYSVAQEYIYQNEDLALSVFRLQIRRLAPLPDGWFVSIVGETPSEDHQEHFRRILSEGEAVELPSEVTDALIARRELLSKQGPWVENHYGPTGRRLL